MDKDRKILDKVIGRALSGKNAHAGTRDVFEGADWKLAGIRPEGVPHSLFQLLSHMIYWQDWVVKWFGGEKPPVPKHASGSWLDRAAPASAEEWEEAVRHFQSGLDELDRQSREGDLSVRRGKMNGLEMLQSIAAHNSYHVGQVSLLRQILGTWPPPSGGVTW